MKLTGLRVLDLSLFYPGPMLTLMMADHGAEVIRIEPPEGEPTRFMAPAQAGQSVWFRQTHRGKKSVVLNLKHPDGHAAFLKLARDADVIIEAFRPGVAARLGIDYATVKAVNPRLVYCSLSAFGQTGPLAHNPAHDMAVQAHTGQLAVNNDGNNDGGDLPVVPGVPSADMAGSLTGFAAVLMALLRREKTGEGDYIDAAMFDSLLPWTAHVVGPAFTERVAPTSRDQRSLGAAAFYAVYRTKDERAVVLGGREMKFVETLLNALDRPDQIPLCTGEAGPSQDPVKAFLAATFRQKTQAGWVEWFKGKDVCFAPVLDFVEAFDQEQTTARAMLVMDDGAAHIGTPLKFQAEPGRLNFAVPELGEHSRSVLKAAGYSEAEIDALAASGAIKTAAGTPIATRSASER